MHGAVPPLCHWPRYHYFAGDGSWRLLDGDKIATLLADLIGDELTATGLAAELSLGVVQTAYANGASATYLGGKGVDLGFAKTGVKFVHEVDASWMR